MTEKIHNFFSSSRCIEKEIMHGNKKFKVYLLKDSPAKVNLSGHILVTNLFFEEYTPSEQVAILYHEEYHRRFTTGLKQISYLIKFLFNLRKATWEEEFEADRFAAKNIGKLPVISCLEKSNKLYKDGTIKYNPKTHPTIEERIKMVREMK